MGKLQDLQQRMNWDENAYLPTGIPVEIFHYTSPEGFESILFRNKEMLEIWASRYDCLNDVSEGLVAEDRFHYVCKQMFESGELTTELYDILIGIKPPHTTLMWYRKDEEDIPTRHESKRYICSFSKNPDSLAMWNYYSKGNKYEGFNLGFFSELLCDDIRVQLQYYENDVNMYPVVYNTEEQCDLIRAFIRSLLEIKVYEEELILRYMVSNQLQKWSLIFKNECFKHEEEVRVIIDVGEKKYPSQENIPQIPVQYRITNGYTIPYIVVPFKKECLSGVTIGPLMCDAGNKELQKRILKERFDANNFHVNVHYSKIPVRY